MVSIVGSDWIRRAPSAAPPARLRPLDVIDYIVADGVAMSVTTGTPGLERGRLRASLRRPGDALPRASIAAAPIVWNDVNVPGGVPRADAATILDEIARTGYEGTQLGSGFPRGPALRAMLVERELRLAEVYASLPCSVDGPADHALDAGLERLTLLHEGGGDMLVLAVDGSPERSRASGRASDPGTPRVSDAGWQELGRVVDQLTVEASAAGHGVAWHPHAGTFVETPAELDALLAATSDKRLGVCLDVAHWTVGGGDPVAAIRAFGTRISHVHLKDIDPLVLEDLRHGRIEDFGAAIRARLFTELGAGVIDLRGILRALAAGDYAGWLMVEQDSCWGPPAESAAIGRRVLAQALHDIGVAAA
jgi:inosose dehydratase